MKEQMKIKFMIILLGSILLLLSCSKPKWDNPFDTKVNISITNIQFERISVSQLKLEWEYDFNVSIGQLHIDKRVGNEDFQQDYAIIDINTNTWIDSNVEINQTIVYRLRGIVDQNECEVESDPFYNIIPVPENFTFDILYPNRIPLIWNYNLSGIEGFKIYRQIGTGNWDNIGTINYSQSWIFNDYSFSYGEDYHYHICAFYDEFFSEYSNALIFNISEIYWDDGDCTGAIGGEGSVDFDVAIRYNPSDLTQYDGMYLVQVDFFPCEYNCEYSIRVWTEGNVSGGEGNSGALVVDQFVSSPTINNWNSVKLDNPIYIDSSKELWFGYRCNTQSGYPAGHDYGTAIAWKGDLIHWYGVWESLSEAGFDFNWNIHGIVNVSNGN